MMVMIMDTVVLIDMQFDCPFNSQPTFPAI